MSIQAKPRGDSKLKTLTQDRQAAILEYLEGHSIADTRAWLAADGIKTSNRALSMFRQWHELRQQWEDDEETVDSLLERVRKEIPRISEEELDRIGQLTFSLQAIQHKDLDGFAKIRGAKFKAESEKAKIALRKQAEDRHTQEFAFEKEKWIQESCNKILAAATDGRTREITESQIPNAEKIALLRKHWFSDVDELEKSGEVKLPSIPQKGTK